MNMTCNELIRLSILLVAMLFSVSCGKGMCMHADGGHMCTGISCSGHGRCEMKENSPICVCDEGYKDHWAIYCVPNPLPETCNETNWCLQNSIPTTETLTDIWGDDRSNIWAIGLNGTTIHWDGSTWMEVTNGIGSDLLGVWGASKDCVWAVGAYGTIIRWDGSYWNKIESSTDWLLEGVWGASPDNIWAVGCNPISGMPSIIHWDGVNWSEVDIGTGNRTPSFCCVWGSRKEPRI